MPSEPTTKLIIEYARRLEGIDPRVLEEGLRIARLHRQVEQVIENDLAGWGLNARQVEIIESLYLQPSGTMTPAELADEVGLTRSAMTSALDSLEKAGYTLRKAHSTDRRMVAIWLTGSGRRFISGRLPQRYAKLHRVMASLTSRERSCLVKTYTKVLDLLVSDMAAKAP